MITTDPDRRGELGQRRRRTRRFGRYLAVTAVASPTNLALYLGLLRLGWNPTLANIVAATIVVGPTFVALRYGVWELRGRASLTREVAPFWSYTAVNVALSSLVATGLAAQGASDQLLVGATLGVYTATWFIRFAWLDRVLFTN